jgi:DNA ligase (NAD+)
MILYRVSFQITRMFSEKKLRELNSLNLVDFKSTLDTTKIVNLQKLKAELDEQYYNKGNQAISDDKYDILVEFLKESIETFTPTIGCKIKDGDNKVSLPFNLNSMDKIKQGETKKLDKWLEHNDDLCSFVISDKLNGISCLACYSDSGNVTLYTRGDGIVGSDISYLKDFLKGIPKGLKNIAVRGELIVEQSKFESEYSSEYKNSLGMLVSVVNAKSLKKPIKDIRFVAYEVVTEKASNSPSENLENLKKYGFEVVSYTLKTIISNVELETFLSERITKSVYPIDGIIIHINKPYNRSNIEASGNPRYAFAYKMVTDSCETEVVDVIWTASRYSVLKPRIQIKPVELCGATINFATGNNAKFIVDNRINKGSKVLVVRSGEIIPKIEQVLTYCDTPLLPKTPYVWSSTQVDIKLTDGVELQDDVDVLVKKISYFFSTVGFKQIAEGVARKLIAAGFDDVFKILDMTVDDFKKIQTFEDKMSNRLYSNIKERLSDHIDVSTLMVASGLFGQGIGIKKLKMLFSVIPTLLTCKITEAEICKVDGFSVKTANKIIQNLENFKLFLDKFNKYSKIDDSIEDATLEIVFTEDEIRLAKQLHEKSQRLRGEVVVFTNFRDYTIQDKLTSLGAEIGDSVTKKTTCLVVPDGNKSTTGKVAKANQYGVKILEVTKFVKEYKLG